jgi:Ser/Thr protein kinase RdoA (MazF antagonist)
LTRVDIGGAPAFVLREYGNHNSARNIEHELSVLLQLQRHKLPFRVPAPEITRRGEICASIMGPNGLKLFVLLPYVNGVNPDPANLRQARNVGAAIAHLCAALKKVDARGLRLPPPYAELGRVHPLVDDPLHALTDVDELAGGLEPTLLTRGNALLQRLTADVVPARLRELGAQLTHGDIIPGNVLCDGDAVSAVIDFENCALNPRPTDLAAALDTWLFDVLATPDALWARCDALVGGFKSVTKLAREEIEALPDLLMLRNASVLMHLCGRFITNLTPLVDVENWLTSMLELEDWLSANGTTLKERVARV